jgi:hypothetical protein
MDEDDLEDLWRVFKQVKTGLLVPTSWRMKMMMMYAVCPSVNEKQCCCFKDKRKERVPACIRSTTLRATGNEAAARHNFYSSYCLSSHSYKKTFKLASALSMHARTRLITDSPTLSKVMRWLRMVWQASNLRWWSVYSFSIGAEYTTLFKCPHSWKTQGLKSGERGGYTLKT